ncbi:MAG: MFS transporter [Caldilineae bacterium]|nr:MFS transporter [Anaerolineae bacterium]MCB9154469.1 MFS transporter [Caldilineae bacterium]
MSDKPVIPANWKAPFFTIWTGQTISLIGSQIVQFALVWYLTEQTGSATVLATATLVAMLPMIVFGPFAGALVDRWNRRLVMIAADGAVALASLWLAYMFAIDAVQVWQVYLIMFIRALGGAFQWPAMQASTTLMVPEQHLTRVAGMNQTLNGALNIVGPPLGALAMSLMPLSGVMMVDVGTALLAVVPLLFVHIPQPAAPADAVAGAPRPSLWADVRGAMRYVWGWPGMLALIGAAMVFKIALTPAFALLPLLVSQHFGGDAAQLGLLEAIFGVGVVASGLLLSVWGGFRRRIYTLLTGMLILSGGLLALGLTPAVFFAMAVGAVLVIGLAIPLIDGPMMAIMQASVAPEMQGRVFMLMASLVSLTSPIGLAIAGPVSDSVGLQVWYLTAAVLCGVIGVAGFFIPVIVNVEQNGHGEVAAEAVPAGEPV